MEIPVAASKGGMMFRRAIPFFLSALAPLTAADFPVVPRSRRVLSEAEVKEFWISRLRTIHPRQAAEAALPEERRVERARQKELIEEIQAGRHDMAARLVSLSHNAEAWSRQGNVLEVEKVERKLLRLRERLAAEARRSTCGEGEAAGRSRA